MSFPQKKIRILSEVTTISRNQDPYQIQSSQKQNDQGFPQQKIIRNSSNYEQGNRLTLRPHNQILSKEFGLQPPQHIQPNRLSSSMMDKSQQNTAQRNASIRIISGPNPQKNIKFKVINQEDKQKMAILMSPNEYQLKQSSQKHQENHRQIYMPQMDAILQKRAQEPSNQSNPNLEQFQNQQYFQQQYLLQQQQQQYYQQSQQQQQQQSQSQQQQQSQQQSYQQSKQQQKQQQQTQQVVQQSQKKLISQKQQQQQEQQQQQQKFLAQLIQQYQQQSEQQQKQQQYQKSDQEEEQNLTNTVLQTAQVNCFKCKTSISKNIYSLQCQHFYHQECFLELVSNQIIQNNNRPNVYCYCNKQISASLLKDLGANKGELEENLFKKQLRILKSNYQKKIISCNFCDYFCINDQKFKNNMVCQNDHDIYKKSNKKI